MRSNFKRRNSAFDVLLFERFQQNLFYMHFRAHTAIYEAELDIYSSERQVLLIDGDYELSLTRFVEKNTSLLL